jgi:hypothetical protein
MNNLQTLIDAERDLNVRYRQVAADLAAASVQAADAAVAGGASWDSATSTVAKLRAESDSITAAIAGIRQQREGSIKLAHTAKALGQRHQAEAKRQEVSALRKKTAAPLEQLASLEGIDLAGAILKDRASNSSKLLGEADALERAGKDLENFPPKVDRGHAEGADLDSLMAAIYSKPELIAPSESTIREWYEAIAAQLHQPRFAGDRVIQIRLVWRESRIDAGNSHVEIRRAEDGYAAKVFAGQAVAA